MFYGILVFLFALVCLMLIGIVLIQSSKSGGLGTAMGGAAVQAAFGGHGAGKLLTRVTVGLAVSFMALALVINFIGAPGSGTRGSGQSIISSRAETDVVDLAAPLEFAPETAPEEATTEPAGEPTTTTE